MSYPDLPFSIKLKITPEQSNNFAVAVYLRVCKQFHREEKEKLLICYFNC